MKQISVNDMTLIRCAKTLSFKEKIEIARHLDNLHVDVIDMPKIENVTTDSLLIRTIAAFVKNSTISVSTDITLDSVRMTKSVLSVAKKSRLKICMPVSPIQMEYVCHKKPHKILELADELFATAREQCESVELFAMDATRADISFLRSIIEKAIESGINTITLCDDEGAMLPDEFAQYIQSVKREIPQLDKVALGIQCKNMNGLATASALMAMKVGATEIKCGVGFDDIPQLKTLANIISCNGDRIGVQMNLNFNEFQRISKQIEWILGVKKTEKGERSLIATSLATENDTPLDANDSLETITKAVKALGYDLSEDDYIKVYDEFVKVADRKKMSSRDLDAIVANVALQVPPTYKLISYVINNGNIISASAQIKLQKNDTEISGVCTGDGPVDASFRTLEQIIGHHFELDDFQIQSVTEGREAMGAALVRLRHNGKLFSGNGISTDIIGSSIRAYINAVNKIVYEEA